MKPLSTKFYYWVSNSFIPAGSIANWCSNFLIIHHIDFCISSYFGVGDPQCSINFQENLKVSDNGVSNSIIHLRSSYLSLELRFHAFVLRYLEYVNSQHYLSNWLSRRCKEPIKIWEDRELFCSIDAPAIGWISFLITTFLTL